MISCSTVAMTLLEELKEPTLCSICRKEDSLGLNNVYYRLYPIMGKREYRFK